MLYFPSTMRRLCQRKFLRFDDTASFRAGAYAIVCSKISIGRNVVIRPGCGLYAAPADPAGTITISDDVLVGPGVQFIVSNHAFSRVDVPIREQGHTRARPILVQRGAWIGSGVIVLPGVTIGENAVVGAGSVVVESVPARVVVAGNPTRVISRVDTGKGSDALPG